MNIGDKYEHWVRGRRRASLTVVKVFDGEVWLSTDNQKSPDPLRVTADAFNRYLREGTIRHAT